MFSRLILKFLIANVIAIISLGTAVAAEEKKNILESKNIIIATGSRSSELPGTKQSNNIVDSEGALKFDSIPKELIVIGAGIIGLELGSVWARLGSKVTIIESQPDFLPFLDARLSRQVRREFERQGLDIRLETFISDISETDSEIAVKFIEKGEEKSLVAEKIIIAIGRKPNSEGLFNQNLLSLDEKGFV